MRDHLRRLLSEAEACGLDRVRVEHHGERHPRLIGELVGERFSFPVPVALPGHKHGLKNYVASLRRAVRARTQAVVLH